MAYNNGFPINYGYQMPQMQQIPQMPQVPQMQQQQNNSPIIWVQGEAGAKSYLIAPNNTVPLWDSEAQTIYLKSADAAGMPSIKILDYTIRDTANTAVKTPLSTPGDEYATKKELEAFKAEILEKMSSLTEASAEDE